MSSFEIWPVPVLCIKPLYFFFTRIIRTCLSIWSKSPQAYKELRSGGILVLPSGRLLQYYKNSVKQEPGLNKEVFELMRDEAAKEMCIKVAELEESC